MRKFIVPLILLLFLTVAFSSVSFSQTSQNKFPSEGIVLNKTHLDSPACSGYPPNSVKPDDQVITVQTNTAPGKSLKYEYSASGGMVIGTGKKVQWDLSKTRSGTYTITVEVKGKNNFRRTFAARIDVPGCIISDCFCPTISIQYPTENIKIDDEITLSATINGSSDSAYTYKWNITGGKIIDGQGTAHTKVKVDNSATNTLTVKVKIGGTCSDCINTVNETIPLTQN